MKLKLTLEYDGSDFRGWARQPGARTVEGVVRDALDATYASWDGLAVAGRTDTGVHATGQVASVDVGGGPPAERAAEALNTALPADVAVVGATVASDDFHARFSATGRSYRYVVFTRRERAPLEASRSLWWPRPLDDDALAAAAALLPGEHDFTAFTPTETSHVRFLRRVLEARWSRESETVLRFEIEADAFMRRMVRVIVGTTLEVGSGRRGLDDFLALLEGAPRERAGETAAAHGLYLIGVDYGG